jgi:hypothetical protein
VVFLVDDGNGNTNTCSALVTVQDQSAPSIAAQPQDSTNHVGAAAGFSVSATACTTLSYQWLFNSSALGGKTNDTLTLASVGSSDAGSYQVVVTSDGGSITSAVAVLTVINDPPVILGQQMLGNGSFQLSFSGPEGQTYTVLASPDASWLMPDWSVLTNGTFGAGPVTVTDADATNSPARVYRISSP